MLRKHGELLPPQPALCSLIHRLRLPRDGGLKASAAACHDFEAAQETPHEVVLPLKKKNQGDLLSWQFLIMPPPKQRKLLTLLLCWQAGYRSRLMGLGEGGRDRPTSSQCKGCMCSSAHTCAADSCWWREHHFLLGSKQEFPWCPHAANSEHSAHTPPTLPIHISCLHTCHEQADHGTGHRDHF